MCNFHNSHIIYMLIDIESIDEKTLKQIQNKIYLRKTPAKNLCGQLLPFMKKPSKEGVILDDNGNVVSKEMLEAEIVKVMPELANRVYTYNKLNEMSDMLKFLFIEPKVTKAEIIDQGKLDAPKTLEALESSINLIKEIESGALVEKEADLVESYAYDLGIWSSNFVRIVKAAIMGYNVDLYFMEAILALGTENVIGRIKKAMGLFPNGKTLIYNLCQY